MRSWPIIDTARAAAPPVRYAIGFSWRKRSLVRSFVGGGPVVFVRAPSSIKTSGVALVWAGGAFGSLVPDKEFAKTLPPGLTIERHYVEDGFLRSVGLGADLIKPVSWVIDSVGIYYDASRPSALEIIFQSHAFDQALLARARVFRKRLVDAGLTKYNVGQTRCRRPEAARGRRPVLVVGQVETDAAIRLGATGVKTNMALLQAARLAHPADWLIYKPHPDVVAGLRNEGQGENQAGQWCDEIVTDTSMDVLLHEVEVVHVITSLAGFEGVLRGKQVVCHGLPFYAGWGLTRDMVSSPRRQRTLSVDQLVAGALLLYPTYISRASGLRCQAEEALDELIAWRALGKSANPLWRRLLRPFIKHA